jgi:hypothetical protein
MQPGGQEQTDDDRDQSQHLPYEAPQGAHDDRIDQDRQYDPVQESEAGQ